MGGIKAETFPETPRQKPAAVRVRLQAIWTYIQGWIENERFVRGIGNLRAGVFHLRHAKQPDFVQLFRADG